MFILQVILDSFIKNRIISVYKPRSLEVFTYRSVQIFELLVYKNSFEYVYAGGSGRIFYGNQKQDKHKIMESVIKFMLTVKSFLQSKTAPLIVFLLVFIGTVGAIGNYGFMDDYSILESSISNDFNYEIYLSLGRPIVGYFSGFIFSFIDSIDQLIYLHILGSVTLSLFGLSCFYYYRKYSSNNIQPILLSVIPILVSPGLLLISAWTVMSSLIASIFPAVLAAFLIQRSTSKKSVVVSVCLLILSFLGYPPSAIIFIALPCIAYLFSLFDNNVGSKQSAAVETIRFSFLMISSAGIISLSALKIISSNYGQTSNRTSLFGPLDEKIAFLLDGAIPATFDFLKPSWGFSIYGFCAVLLVGILPLLLLRINRLKTWFILTFAVLVVFAPNIITAENWPSNRSLYPAQWTVSSIALLGLLALVKRIRVGGNSNLLLYLISPILLTFTIFNSNNILIETMRDPQLAELEYSRIALSKLDLNSPINVKKSEWNESLSPWLSADEFGIPSTCQTWVPVPFVKLLLREVKGNHNPEVTLVSNSNAENLLDFSDVLGEAKQELLLKR